MFTLPSSGGLEDFHCSVVQSWSWTLSIFKVARFAVILVDTGSILRYFEKVLLCGVDLKLLKSYSFDRIEDCSGQTGDIWYRVAIYVSVFTAIAPVNLMKDLMGSVLSWIRGAMCREHSAYPGLSNQPVIFSVCVHVKPQRPKVKQHGYSLSILFCKYGSLPGSLTLIHLSSTQKMLRDNICAHTNVEHVCKCCKTVTVDQCTVLRLFMRCSISVVSLSLDHAPKLLLWFVQTYELRTSKKEKNISRTGIQDQSSPFISVLMCHKCSHCSFKPKTLFHGLWTCITQSLISNENLK